MCNPSRVVVKTNVDPLIMFLTICEYGPLGEVHLGLTHSGFLHQVRCIVHLRSILSRKRLLLRGRELARPGILSRDRARHVVSCCRFKIIDWTIRRYKGQAAPHYESLCSPPACFFRSGPLWNNIPKLPLIKTTITIHNPKYWTRRSEYKMKRSQQFGRKII